MKIHQLLKEKTLWFSRYLRNTWDTKSTKLRSPLRYLREVLINLSRSFCWSAKSAECNWFSKEEESSTFKFICVWLQFNVEILKNEWHWNEEVILYLLLWSLQQRGTVFWKRHWRVSCFIFFLHKTLKTDSVHNLMKEDAISNGEHVCSRHCFCVKFLVPPLLQCLQNFFLFHFVNTTLSISYESEWNPLHSLFMYSVQKYSGIYIRIDEPP
jgi:hypothetical protein